MFATIWRKQRMRFTASLLIGFAVGWGLYLVPLERPRALLPALPERASTPLIQFSPDSRRLAIAQLQRNPDRHIKGAGFNSCNLRLWNAIDGSLAAELAENDDCIVALAFAPDSNSLAARFWNGEVRIWNSLSGIMTEKWPVQKTRFFEQVQLLYDPEARLLAQDTDERTKLRDVRTGAVVYDCGPTVKPYQKVLTQLRGVFVAQRERETLVFRMDQPEVTGKFVAEPFSVFSFSQDCQSMLGIAHGKYCIWRVNGGIVDSIAWGGETVSGFNFISPDGRHCVLFETKAEKKWRFFGARTGTFSGHATVYAVQGPELESFAKATSGMFSPDGKTLVFFRDFDGVVQLWDFPPAKPWRWILGGAICAAAIVYGVSGWTLARIAKKRVPAAA